MQVLENLLFGTSVQKIAAMNSTMHLGMTGLQNGSLGSAHKCARVLDRPLRRSRADQSNRLKTVHAFKWISNFSPR